MHRCRTSTSSGSVSTPVAHGRTTMEWETVQQPLLQASEEDAKGAAALTPALEWEGANPAGVEAVEREGLRVDGGLLRGRLGSLRD